MAQPIAVGSILIECNHFGGAPADLGTFRRGELLFGDSMLDVVDGVVGGMLSVLRRCHRAPAG